MHTLVARLRNIESEALRMLDVDLPAEMESSKKTYKLRLEALSNSHSRSWFGDHSSTYYRDFHVPPAGRSFDVEWGFVPGFDGARNQGWLVYSRDDIRSFVFNEIGEDIFYKYNELSEDINSQFSQIRDQLIDILNLISKKIDGNLLNRYIDRISSGLEAYSYGDYINSESKSAPRMTRDSEEISKGSVVPVHIQYFSKIISVDVNKKRIREMSAIIRNVIELVDMSSTGPTSSENNNKIFIGHGRSEQWRILKDFLRDKLNLEYDEFNRIPIAGIGTQERLVQMLDECGFALLVLTGEDFHGNNSLHARENVIHEAGLFQGRLGLRKAIVLLEDECEEFSNISGFGQIRFPKGNIAASFEQIREVLGREGVM